MVTGRIGMVIHANRQARRQPDGHYKAIYAALAALENVKASTRARPLGLQGTSARGPAAPFSGTATRIQTRHSSVQAVTAWQPNKEEANLPQRLSRQPHSLTALQKFRRQAREGSSKRSCTGCTFRVASDLAWASNAVI